MRQLSLLVTTALVFNLEAAKTLKPIGPVCPQGDGLYAVDCSSKYLQCLDNIEFEQTCPVGLYFDRLMARCERRSDNYLCAPNVKALNVRQKAVVIDCSRRLSGDHPLDQTINHENYYRCESGILYMRRCPQNKVYIATLRRCDLPSHFNSSDVASRAAAAYASPTIDAENFVITTKEVENGHIGIDCNIMDNSFMTNSTCTPFFFQCSNKKLFRKTCPKGMMYVLQKNICDYPNAVKGCPQYDGSETVYEPASPPKPTPTATPVSAEIKVDFDCSGKLNGDHYKVACSKDFFRCHNGMTFARSCPEGLVYSQRSAYCDYPENCEKNMEPSQYGYKPKKYAIIENNTTTPGPVNIFPNAEAFSCYSRRDGIYSLPYCSEDFVRCVGGQSIVVACPSPLFYSDELSACDYKEKVAICNTPQEPNSVDINWCLGKPNGYYVTGCSSHFISCNHQTILKMSCPSGLKFSEKNGICTYASDVPECSMSKKPTVVPPETPADTTTPTGDGKNTTTHAPYVASTTTAQRNND